MIDLAMSRAHASKNELSEDFTNEKISCSCSAACSVDVLGSQRADDDDDDGDINARSHVSNVLLAVDLPKAQRRCEGRERE